MDAATQTRVLAKQIARFEETCATLIANGGQYFDNHGQGRTRTSQEFVVFTRDEQRIVTSLSKTGFSINAIEVDENDICQMSTMARGVVDSRHSDLETAKDRLKEYNAACQEMTDAYGISYWKAVMIIAGGVRIPL